MPTGVFEDIGMLNLKKTFDIWYLSAKYRPWEGRGGSQTKMIVGLDTTLTQKAVTLLTVQSPQKSRLAVLKWLRTVCSL